MFEGDQQSLSGKLDELKSSVDLLHEVLSRLDSEIAAVHQRLEVRIGRLEGRLYQEDPLVESGSEARRNPRGIDAGDLNELIRRLSVGTNQEEILEIFLEESQNYVDRAILFLHQDHRFVPWKSIGFPSEAISDVEPSLVSDPIVRAARQRRIIHRTDGLAEAFPWLARTGTFPSSAICIPLVFDDVVPVVLYADHRDSANLDSLELLTHLTLLHLKNNYLLHLSTEGGGPTTAADGAAEPAEGAARPAAPFEEQAGVIEETLEEPESPTGEETRAGTVDFETPEVPPAQAWDASEPPAVEEAEESDFTFEESPGASADTERRPEESFRKGEVSGEPPFPSTDSGFGEDTESGATAEASDETMVFGTAPVPPEAEAEETQDEVEQVGKWTQDLPAEEESTETEEVSASAEAEVGEEEPAHPVEGDTREASPVLSEEEQREHNEARRFARLLVSEIKLYNEEMVQQGRDHSDLYSRLQGDIDRSREMYEKRVHSDIAASSDYFHEELVRILAGGNDDLLGEEYPGPRPG